MKWIGQQRGGYGGFGSTQSTILALKALIAYTTREQADGGGRRADACSSATSRSANLAFPAGASEALTLEMPDAEKYLKPGTNNGARGDHGQEHLPVHADLDVPDAEAGQRRTAARCG